MESHAGLICCSRYQLYENASPDLLVNRLKNVTIDTDVITHSCSYTIIVTSFWATWLLHSLAYAWYKYTIWPYDNKPSISIWFIVAHEPTNVKPFAQQSFSNRTPIRQICCTENQLSVDRLYCYSSVVLIAFETMEARWGLCLLYFLLCCFQKKSNAFEL